MMQCVYCIKEWVAIKRYHLLLPELWLKLESFQRVPATSIKQQSTGSSGESNAIYRVYGR